MQRAGVEAVAAVKASIRAWKIIKFPTKGSVPPPQGGAGGGGGGGTREGRADGTSVVDVIYQTIFRSDSSTGEKPVVYTYIYTCGKLTAVRENNIEREKER